MVVSRMLPCLVPFIPSLSSLLLLPPLLPPCHHPILLPFTLLLPMLSSTYVEKRKCIISYKSERDLWLRYGPYFMLLFDSVGHYFRLRREMLLGSRFTVLFLFLSFYFLFFLFYLFSSSLLPPLVLFFPYLSFSLSMFFFFSFHLFFDNHRREICRVSCCLLELTKGKEGRE